MHAHRMKRRAGEAWALDRSPGSRRQVPLMIRALLPRACRFRHPSTRAHDSCNVAAAVVRGRGRDNLWDLICRFRFALRVPQSGTSFQQQKRFPLERGGARASRTLVPQRHVLGIQQLSFFGWGRVESLPM